jgi:hypothetical protein
VVVQAKMYSGNSEEIPSFSFASFVLNCAMAEVSFTSR